MSTVTVPLPEKMPLLVKSRLLVDSVKPVPRFMVPALAVMPLTVNRPPLRDCTVPVLVKVPGSMVMVLPAVSARIVP